MVRSCRYSTPLWLFEKNNRRDSGSLPPPPLPKHEFLNRYHHVNVNSGAAKPFSVRFGGAGARLWGVGGGEGRCTVTGSEIPPLCSSTTKGFHSGADGFACFLRVLMISPPPPPPHSRRSPHCRGLGSHSPRRP